ncbi:SET domain-containing protein [Calocera cornea HHB12733]|uniref:SET domain-containing protein n=1 Tax=Calocera cornea HHB12733 TaxID=1353952 RepID=A0A165E7V3_9BASI|nr:SET domain-containing protein [Calocera cornea HHB12733]
MDTRPDSLCVQWAETPGAGRGLIAVKDIPALRSLFYVPAGALMNARTLAPFFPANTIPSPGNARSTLSAVQALSLYLAANRYDQTCPWAPYIKVLPVEFHDHPLNAVLIQRYSSEMRPREPRARHAALSMAPPAFLSLLHEAAARFEQDFEAVKACLARHRDLFGLNGEVDVVQFIWGWLNVNTRQVWTALDLSKCDNITLAPIFDMCNHTPGSGGKLMPVSSRKAVCLHVPYDLKKGDEVYIQYGFHGNAKLLAEYGFMLHSKESSAWTVSVVDLMVPMFEAKGPHGKDMLACLEQHGYLAREFALHLRPEPPSPSYGLIVALRLLHSASSSEDYVMWFQMLWSGQFSETHPGVDQAVSNSLRDMCDVLIKRAEHALGLLEDARLGSEDVKALWHEELIVAAAVKRSLSSGLIDFD